MLYLRPLPFLTLLILSHFLTTVNPFSKWMYRFLNILSADTSRALAEQPQDDFSMGIAFFLLIGVVFSLICIGIGIVLAVLVVLFLVGLISMGLISGSVVIGLYKKSFLKGLKAFIRLSVITGGLLTGTAGLWTLNKFTHWWTTKSAIITGAAAGMLSGYILSVFIFFLFRRVQAYLKVQFGDHRIFNRLKL